MPISLSVHMSPSLEGTAFDLRAVRFRALQLGAFFQLFGLFAVDFKHLAVVVPASLAVPMASWYSRVRWHHTFMAQAKSRNTP